jgi:hypothetical protein
MEADGWVEGPEAVQGEVDGGEVIDGLPEPEHADLVAHSHRYHDTLHLGRVVEYSRVVHAVPIIDRAAVLGDEPAEGVVFDDAHTENIEAVIGDWDGSSVARGRGGVAGDDIRKWAAQM